MKIIHSKKIFIQVKNGLSPRAIPHWTHCTNLSNLASPRHSSSQTYLHSASQPHITFSFARTSPPSWSPPSFSHLWWPRPRLWLQSNRHTLMGPFCQVGPTTCLGPVHVYVLTHYLVAYYWWHTCLFYVINMNSLYILLNTMIHASI